MKIAIIHDQLQEFGGAERVLISLKNIYPEADVYTSFVNKETLGTHAKKIEGWKIYTSWADKIPFFKKLYSPFRFLTPYIWESFDFSKYDVVISSSGWYMCKGVITKPSTVHICYLHHPPRHLYYYETAVEWQKFWPIKIYGHLTNHVLRLWDYISSQRPNHFIANSIETKKRIKKFYRRDSEVIYPPVRLADKANLEKVGEYYLSVSRLARAKHLDIIIQSANKNKFKLKIVGVGRDGEYLKSIAGDTVEFLGDVTDTELNSIYRNAKAFLFASVDEEFGISPVEAMSHGLPVIALKSGGLKETVIDGKNGYLFNDLSEESLSEKINAFEKLSDKEKKEMKKTARRESEKYSEENFKSQILKFVKSKI